MQEREKEKNIKIVFGKYDYGISCACMKIPKLSPLLAQIIYSN